MLTNIAAVVFKASRPVPQEARFVVSTSKKCYLTASGLISLGGGLPSSEHFPFERVDVKIPRPPHFSEQETVESGIVTSMGKYDIAKGESLYG